MSVLSLIYRIEPEAEVSCKLGKTAGQVSALCGQGCGWIPVQHIHDLCSKCGPICRFSDEEHESALWLKLPKGVSGEAL